MIENSFSETRLVLFEEEHSNHVIQGFIVAEKNIIFEVTEFDLVQGLISLLASYYVFHLNYPKSLPANLLLLLMQEHLIEDKTTAKKLAKYTTFIRSILKDSV